MHCNPFACTRDGLFSAKQLQPMRVISLASLTVGSALVRSSRIMSRGGAARAAFYDLADVNNDGSACSFSQFEGKVCFAQNVASA